MELKTLVTNFQVQLDKIYLNIREDREVGFLEAWVGKDKVAYLLVTKTSVGLTTFVSEEQAQKFLLEHGLVIERFERVS